MSTTGRYRKSLLVSALAMVGMLAVAACSAAAPAPRDADTATSDSAGDASAEGASSDAAGVMTTGIRGTVLRGPIAGGPIVEGRPSEAPFKAKFVIRDGEGNQVAEFESDDEGLFEVALPPGDYVVIPAADAPVFRPMEQPHAVTVPEDEIVEVTLRYDTGMR